jgi:hypothetical protein
VAAGELLRGVDGELCRAAAGELLRPRHQMACREKEG